jgi:hypothetical protein
MEQTWCDRKMRFKISTQKNVITFFLLKKPASNASILYAFPKINSFIPYQADSSLLFDNSLKQIHFCGLWAGIYLMGFSNVNL